MGVDINKSCLKESEKKYPHPNFRFFYRFDPLFEQEEKFNAIYALAVLQHSDNKNIPNLQIAKSFTFQQFEQHLLEIDKKLQVGGLLSIDFTNFNFLETQISRNYKILEVSNNKIVRADRPLFNKQNKRILNIHHCYRIFVKTR